MPENEWSLVETGHGRFSVENKDYIVRVFSDLSAELENKSSGLVVQFDEIKVLIEGAEAIKAALVEKYGGWR